MEQMPIGERPDETVRHEAIADFYDVIDSEEFDEDTHERIGDDELNMAVGEVVAKCFALPDENHKQRLIDTLMRDISIDPLKAGLQVAYARNTVATRVCVALVTHDTSLLSAEERSEAIKRAQQSLLSTGFDDLMQKLALGATRLRQAIKTQYRPDLYGEEYEAYAPYRRGVSNLALTAIALSKNRHP